jgi:Protein of unknown function (DUF1569)
MPVETAKLEGRRKLDYASLEDVLADADRLSSGPVRVLGNWSEGQVFRHLALAYNGSIDGISMTFPWPMRLVARIFKKKLLAGAMPPGFKLPSDGAKALGPAPTTAEEGLAELRAAVARLEREPHRAKHPMFGQVSRDEWTRIHLMHANLHMSFLVPLP